MENNKVQHTGKILVTGGTGYIGSHTVVELQQQGFDVIVVDNLSNSRLETMDGIEKITGIRPVFEQVDLCDMTALTSVFDRHQGISNVIHFAAFKAVGESVQKPLKYYHNNLVSLINLLTILSGKEDARMIFSSSCTVYGQPDKLPVDEKSPVKKANCPYGNIKQISEEIIEDTLHAFPSMKAIALRYFNPIGAHESALIGELPLGVPDNLVPYITQTAIGIREQLQVFGDDYNTPDGTCIRDYIHVVDLAKAHAAALSRLLQSSNHSRYEVFNLGTGRGYSVMEVLKTFEKINRLKVNYLITKRRQGDVEQVFSDTTYANETLGWKAERSLEEMLRSAWEWEKYYRGENNR